MNAVTQLLLDNLEQAFRKKAWHGANLLGSLRGISPEEAAWRPEPARHNIWEQIVHTAYWKYTVTRRLTGGERGSFPLKGSNWFPRPVERSEAALRADLNLLKECHQALLAAVAKFPPEQLPEVPPGSAVTFQMLITGIAAHDLYHTGQIQLLKRLQGGNGE